MYRDDDKRDCPWLVPVISRVQWVSAKTKYFIRLNNQAHSLIRVNTIKWCTWTVGLCRTNEPIYSLQLQLLQIRISSDDIRQEFNNNNYTTNRSSPVTQLRNS